MRLQAICQGFEAVELVLIIVYCALSQSICSTFALAVLLIDLTLILNKFYQQKEQESSMYQPLTDRKHRKVFEPLQLRKYLWIASLIVNFCFLIFKIIYFTSGKPYMSEDMQVAFEVNNYVAGYVPILLILVGAPLVLVKDQNKKIIKFLKPTSQAFILPVYLLLVILLVLIQIFNTSVLGLLLVFILIILVGRRKWGFVNGRLEISIIQFIIGIYIVLAFLSSMSIIPFFQTIEFYGLECLKPNQWIYGSNKAYFFCLIAAFLVANFINSMFGYEKMHALIKKYDIHLEQAIIQEEESDIPEDVVRKQKYQAMNNIRKYEKVRKSFSQIQMEDFSQIIPDTNTKSVLEQPKRESKNDKGNKVERQKQKEKEKEKQEGKYQDKLKQEQEQKQSVVMIPSPSLPNPQISPISSELKQSVQPQPPVQLKKSAHLKMSRMQARQERVNSKSRLKTSNSKLTDKQSQLKAKQKQQSKFWTAISNFLTTCFQFLTSLPLNFRLTQFFSIVIIQRYNTIYSMILIVWLVSSALITKALYIRYSIIFLVFPLAIANYCTSFLFNIPQSPITNIQCGSQPCSIYGFELFNNFYWDIIIFDVYILFILNFIKYSDMEGLQNMVYEDKIVQEAYRLKPKAEVSYLLLFVAFIFKYTHLITLILLYWVGFDAANLLHLVLIIAFLVFYAFGSTIIFKQRVKANGKTTQMITTFTQSYWFVIVIFIGIAIFLKYIYFLFFPNYHPEWIDPIGIAEVYNVPFNFSFKSCQSNTTPLFWIFILSTLQLAITQSTIYLQYSYSILAVLSQKETFKSHSKKINEIITFTTAFYYKSLFAMSAVITLLSNFRWSVNGILMVSLTTYGLLFGFKAGRLWVVVMWINITHIFFNYFFMFLDYPAVIDLFTPRLANEVIKYSYMLGGFQITSGGLHSLFLQSIFIFIVSVQCTQLYHYLIEVTDFDENNNVRHISLYSDPADQVASIVEKAQKIQLNQQLDDNEIEYANANRRAKIHALKQLWNMDMFTRYDIMRKLWQLLIFFYMDISLLFVILCSVFYRLSVSMFLYLVIYLTYYFVVFHQIHNVYQNNKFYNHLYLQIDFIDENIDKLYNQKTQHLYQNTGDFQQFKQTFLLVKVKMQQIKSRYKKWLWLASSILTIICLILTYASQFFISYYCINYCPVPQQHWVFITRKVLFILGLSTSQQYTLWRSIYFYFWMVLINLIQRCANNWTHNMQKKKQEVQIQKVLQENLALNVDNKLERMMEQQYLMKEQQKKVPQDDIQSQRFQPLDFTPIKFQPRPELPQNNSLQNLKNVNLLCFFQINGSNIKIKLFLGILSATLRLYILLLLLNSYAKSNIFSWIYLGVALIYWNISLNFAMVQNINKVAIVILLLQYALLLFNLNSFDAPYYQTQFQPYTLAGKSKLSSVWLSYLAFGGQYSGQFKTSTSLIINSLIIFATQYYFRLFALVCGFIISSFIKIKNFYDYTLNRINSLKPGETIYINSQSFKSRSYIVLCKIYELCTVNSFLLLSTMILLIIDGFNSALSILLLLISSVYFYMAMFGKSREDQKMVDKYTYTYFMLYKIIAFLQFVIINIFNLPPITSMCTQATSHSFMMLVCTQLNALNIFGQLVLLFFVQLWLDLQRCKQFQRFSTIYYKTSYSKQLIMARCHAYKVNDDLFKELFYNYQIVLNFQLQIQQALKLMQEWFTLMKRQDQFKSLKEEQFSFFNNKRQLISQEWKKNHKQGKKLLQILKQSINHTLYLSNADLVMQMRTQNSRILQDLQVNFSEYVLDNLDLAIQKSKELDDYNQYLYLEIIAKNQYKKIMKQEIQKLGNIEPQPSQVIIPSILDLNIKKQKLSIFEIIAFFIISKFDYILTLAILIYYLVNPALLSLPIVVLMFSYQIISQYKVKNFVLLYILVIVIFLQVADEIITIGGNQTPTWFSYLFYNVQYSDDLSTGYLNFLFVMILINQIIKKSTGLYKRYPIELENQYQALLRLILDYQDPLNPSLFNILEQDHMQSVTKIVGDANSKMEDEMNPYIIYSQTLEKNPQLIYDNSIPSFFKNFYKIKAGADLYPIIAVVQIFLTLYLIFFYPLMVNNNAEDLDQTFVYYSFSADMIIVILIHVATIVIERRLTLLQKKNGTKQLIKYIYTMVVLALVCVFVFYYAPSGGGTTNEYNYTAPPALQAFMFIQMIYFTLSTLQIKYGYQRFKRLNSLMHNKNLVKDGMMSLFVAIPFLQQLKLLMDWAFAKTSLTLDGWTKLFNIYLTSFFALRTAEQVRQTKPGSQVPLWKTVIIGWCGFVVLLLLIFGPMIIFSGLNPATQSNLVVGGSLQIGLSIVDGNYFQFYSTSHFSSAPSPVSRIMYNQMGFNKVPILQSMKKSQLAQQFQYVNYFPYSDNLWEISYPNFEYLNQTINQALISYSKNQTPQHSFSMQTNYQLNRNITDTVSTPSTFNYPFLNGRTTLNRKQLESLNNTLNLCNTPTYFPNFYISLIRLDTSGNSYHARPIYYYNSSSSLIPQFTETVSIQLKCSYSPDGSTVNATGIYWMATVVTNNAQQQAGLVLFVLCDKYQKLTFGLSFIGLYASVVLVIASFIRQFFTGDLGLIPYNMNPNPEYILNICEAIYTMRMRGNLRAQYILYYALIDIMRSPQIIKFMCKSFTNVIKQYDKKMLLKQQQEKNEKLE